MNEWVSRIEAWTAKAGKDGLSLKELFRKLKLKDKQKDRLREVLDGMVQQGTLAERRNRFFHTGALGWIPAQITRVQKTFGFARETDGETEYFIPGKYLMGALPEDRVLLKPIRSWGSAPEAEVTRITAYGPGEFTGTLHREGGEWKILPDKLAKQPMRVQKGGLGGAKEGDKVLARIVSRGKRHSEHRAEVLSSYGDAQTAASCAAAALDLAGITPEFPAEVEDKARRLQQRGIREKDLIGRTDFRGEIVFTIDGADSKDLDDAVSLEKQVDGYLLGVHIADVSHYVKYRGELDQEAFCRGTSVYYADQVIPMLPRELSNGICSLNPGEDRLTLSVLLALDLEGRLVDFAFCRGVIRSRVKGVYSEVNRILDGTAGKRLEKKYAEVRETLLLMQELVDILRRNKRQRGAPELESRESKIAIGEDGLTSAIHPRVQGEAESMIEEFMLTANEAAALMGRRNEVPFVYRVHEPPAPDRLDQLNEVLRLLQVQARPLLPNAKPRALAELLDKVRGEEIAPVVNLQVLRTMSKAKYSESPLGHYGLALENYAHFTSPIRRYPDLMVHRVLTGLLAGEPAGELRREYGKYVVKAARQSTETEIAAMKLERECEDFYKAEYMKFQIGKEFDGVISSVAAHGVYVELPNTVEGLIRAEDLPDASACEFDGVMSFRNRITGASYRVGQPIRVRCTNAQVSSGNIDFVPADKQERGKAARGPRSGQRRRRRSHGKTI